MMTNIKSRQIIAGILLISLAAGLATPAVVAQSDTTVVTVDEGDEVTKYREIREGQWLTEEPTYRDEDGSMTLSIYSEYDSRIAVVDNMDCSQGYHGVCAPDVTNVRVEGGETTEFTAEATARDTALADGRQQVTLNSLEGRDGLSLRVILLQDDPPLFRGDALWDYVPYAVISSSVTAAMVALTTFIFLRIRGHLREENLIRYVSENL
jgi:hypothetical protein